MTQLTQSTQPRRSDASNAGFSLVELLVVLAIVVLLISILLPALSGSREVTRRTVCLSNLRQSQLAIANFAVDRGGRFVPGYWEFKQFNYPVNIVDTAGGNRQGLGPWGFIYVEEYLNDPTFLICPSNSNPHVTNLIDQPQTSTVVGNQWPIIYHKTGNKRVTRSSYGIRPVVEIKIGANSDNDDPLVLPTVPISDYAGRALGSDTLHGTAQVDTRHFLGVNVVYGDGAARWVLRDVIDYLLPSLDGGFHSSKSKFMLSDDQSTGIFAELDTTR